MHRWLAVLVVGLVAQGTARSQDEIIKDFTPKDLERFIRQEMKTVIGKKVADPNGKSFEYLTPQGVFDVIYDGPAKEVRFRYPYAGQQNILPGRLADWNRTPGRLSRVAIDELGQLSISGKISFDGGISFAKLKEYHDNLKKEDGDLLKFLAEKSTTKTDPARAGDVVIQGFPARTPEAEQNTRWEIDWDLAPNRHKKVHLLRIASARFHFKDGAGKWKSVVVARNLELAEAFASYDDKVTAFLDLFGSPPRANRTVLATDKLNGPSCVAEPKVLNWSKDKQLTIFCEVHDDGLRWIKGNESDGAGENRGRRGEKLVLSSMFQAANYVYVTEYDFTDDGRIVCKLGFTGSNFFNRGKDKDGDVHLHVGCWRMEFDLGDPANNEYQLVRRAFDPDAKRFRMDAKPFNDGHEGKALWKPEEFTSLRVVSGTTKSRAGKKGERPIAYDLMPTRTGSVRGLIGQMDVAKENMDFLNFDFWVTHKPKGNTPYHRVPMLASEKRELAGSPATVWYSVPALHVPRGEDFGADGQSKDSGLALMTWIEFTLRPRDLFDATPLYSR